MKATPQAPIDKELRKLILDSLLLFNTAIQEKDFAGFHGHLAKLWQKQITPETLLENFQSFVDQEIDIAPIARLEPTFEGTPAVNEEGVLVVKGSYPMEPNVSFELKYIFESTAWKLVGIDVHAKATAEKADKNDNDNGMDDSDDDEEDDPDK